MSRELFVTQYNAHIKREGSAELLAWLGTTDFFIAPASTRFHGDYEGGLCQHSLNVFQQFCRLCNCYKTSLGIESWRDKAESIAICALLHDLCKVGCYKVEMRNKKNDETGQWEKVPFYTYQEDNPMGGHGYKSVFLISDYMKLTNEERIAIATHMGAFDRTPGDFALSDAFEEYPFAFLLHVADCAATFMDEKKRITTHETIQPVKE